MSIFACSDCNSIENTALSNYAMRDWDKLPPLCSACDPKISEWHGEFERVNATEAGYWVGEDGFLYDPNDPPHHTALVRKV